MINVAAVGDLHLGVESEGCYRQHVEEAAQVADLLLLAGDLTRLGVLEEAQVVAAELADARLPVVAVLGNHDVHSGQGDKVVRELEDAGVTVLEGTSTTLEVGGTRVGVAGVKGFGGGFLGRCASSFGEPEMKQFVHRTEADAAALADALDDVRDTDVQLVLLHYSPIEATLVGEPPEIYAFLGAYQLAEVVDRAGVDLVVHGHAHRGSEKGTTPAGIHVRNVAQPVLRRAFAVYCVEPSVPVPA